MLRNTPGQFVEIRFEAMDPLPSSNVQRATSLRASPPSDKGLNSLSTSHLSGNPSLSVSTASGSVP